MAVGLNYHPVKQVVVKAEYSHRFLTTSSEECTHTHEAV